MSTIPIHVIFTNILPKLPPKSLLIFKSVSKSWNNYISSDEFISLHLHHSISLKNNQLLILTTPQNSLVSTPLNSLKAPSSLPVFEFSEEGGFRIVGSCNGLVCVSGNSRGGLPVCVVNPCSGVCREIPLMNLPRRVRDVRYGFGYDRFKDEYKVVRVMDYSSRMMLFSNLSRQVSVFSMKSSTWRVVQGVVPVDYGKDGESGAVLRNHLVHWVVWCFVTRKCKIKCFDLCDEKWVGDVPMLNDDGTGELVEETDPDTRGGVLDLGVLDGYLFLSRKNEQRSNQLSLVIDVWIMKEYGVGESWARLLSVSDSSVVGSLRVSPVAYSRRGDKILLRREYTTGWRLCWYNLKNESIEIAKFHGVEECLSADVCVGSLVNVPGGHRN